MKILAIETSCDETGLALIETQDQEQVVSSKQPRTRASTVRGRQDTKIKVLANLLRSQIELHKPYGGVFPNIAKREHKRVLPLMWEELIKLEKLKAKKLDLIAVTQGPGLSPCLWAGISFAEDLAKKLSLPLVGINHLKGHIYIAYPFGKTSDVKERSGETSDVEEKGVAETLPAYPVLSLIVSGGHTELVLSDKQGEYKILGRTQDDAAGEAFDKVARLLGLGYPGGPEISRVAEGANPEAFALPRPVINSPDYNFSFSGLKTAVMYLVKGVGKKLPLEINKKNITNMAASFQAAVVDVLVTKTIRAAKEFAPKTVILGGGVAANNLLRQELETKLGAQLPNIKLILPDKKLTTDNALMIALAAWYEKERLETKEKLEAIPNWRIDQES